MSDETFDDEFKAYREQSGNGSALEVVVIPHFVCHYKVGAHLFKKLRGLVRNRHRDRAINSRVFVTRWIWLWFSVGRCRPRRTKNE